MMGGKGGSSDASGMYMAMSSAIAAQQAYALGEQQLQWSQQVWNQEQPLMDQSEQAQINMYNQMAASQQAAAAESAQQWQMYLDTYAPLEQKFVGQAEGWASPENISLVRGQAMGSVAEQGNAALNSASETLRSYGVNPSSPRYASLYVGAQPMIGASEAAAGTTAEQNLRLQQLGLESGAINTGRGLVNATAGLTTAGTQAGAAGAGAASGAGQTAMSNLSTGSQAMTAPTAWFNAGANNMNSYVGAVNGYNESQASFAQAQASEMGGLGSAIGGLTGLAWMKSDERGKTDIKREGTDTRTGIPLYSYRYKEDPKSYPKVVGPMAQDIAKVAPHRVVAIPGSPGGRLAIRYQDGGDVGVSPDAQYTPAQGGGASGIPGTPLPPQMPPGGTPGGPVPAYASPSMGQSTDDVPAMLTAGEFVIPKDVMAWKGHEYFAKQIDQARKAQSQFDQRDDIGGEPTAAIPQSPTFISRPGAPAMAPGGSRGAIPMMPQQAAA
jgi:Chaperone of endosialidase